MLSNFKVEFNKSIQTSSIREEINYKGIGYFYQSFASDNIFL
ncbi:MAG: hypothetical protein WC384_08535 [Prolixibacteraceae bacterium]